MEKMLNILVVDDNSSMRTLLQDILHLFGFEVRLAENGCEALKKISEKIPDVVITDWQMPGMSGIELIKKIKSSYPDSDIGIILMSSEDIKKEAIEAGADDFIHKPFHPHHLLTKLKKFTALLD
ncbi:MAG: response regulator [Patescibacteria group bacterium]|nr:response regulator [Patescibacteria group bacterium]